MDPLLFANWRRINRGFTRLMWTLAAILVCVVLVAATSTGSHHHSSSSARAVGPAAGARR